VAAKKNKANKTAADTSAAKVAFVQHKVADYEKWKPLYEAHDSVRKTQG
jgi:hypothetical protein